MSPRPPRAVGPDTQVRRSLRVAAMSPSKNIMMEGYGTMYTPLGLDESLIKSPSRKSGQRGHEHAQNPRRTLQYEDFLQAERLPVQSWPDAGTVFENSHVRAGVRGDQEPNSVHASRALRARIHRPYPDTLFDVGETPRHTLVGAPRHGRHANEGHQGRRSGDENRLSSISLKDNSSGDSIDSEGFVWRERPRNLAQRASHGILAVLSRLLEFSWRVFLFLLFKSIGLLKSAGHFGIKNASLTPSLGKAMERVGVVFRSPVAIIIFIALIYALLNFQGDSVLREPFEADSTQIIGHMKYEPPVQISIQKQPKVAHVREPTVATEAKEHPQPGETRAKVALVEKQIESLQVLVNGLISREGLLEKEIGQIDSNQKHLKDEFERRLNQIRVCDNAAAEALDQSGFLAEVSQLKRQIDALETRPKSLDLEHGDYSNLIRRVGEMESALGEVQRNQQQLLDGVKEARKRAGNMLRKDYALQANGARVVRSMTTKQFVPKSLVSRLFGIGYGRPASVALNSNISEGNCWAFRGGSGRLTVRLAERTVIGSVGLDHSESAAGNRVSAPRYVSVFAMADGDFKKVGSFEFQRSGDQRQEFAVESVETDTVQFQFEDNYGAEYTCVYRVRVYSADNE